MRIAVSAEGKNLEAPVDPRFGRASHFILVDTETMSFEVIENKQERDLAQGAGIQAAQNVARHKPEAVLTGNCGPKAFKALKAAKVKVFIGAEGSVEEAVQAFLDNRYQQAEEANVEGHWM
jgi:predicted Fe-Mo cluster-binding NifX family protein